MATDNRIRIHLTDNDGPGRRFGNVVDQQGNTIGSAHDYIYGGRGYAVHTERFGGFVPDNDRCIVYV